MSKTGQVSLEDIATQCHLSRATVWHILNGSSRYKFKEETVQRVKDAAQSLNYRPNLFASALRKRENKLIHCIVGHVCRHSDVEHLKHLEVALGQRGYYMQIQFLVGLSEQMKLDFIRQQINLPAGIAIWSLGLYEGKNLLAFQKLFQNAPPTLSLNQPLPGTNIDYIQILWGGHSAEVAVDYFHQKHFHSVALAYCPADNARNRLVPAFEQAAEAHGMQASCLCGNLQQKAYQYFDAGCEIARQMLATHQLPQAIYCTSDELAFTLIEELRHHGVKVPEDLFVLGGGDSEFCQHLHTPLPVLVHDIPCLCELAAENLVSRIRRGDTTVGTGSCVATIKPTIRPSCSQSPNF